MEYKYRLVFEDIFARAEGYKHIEYSSPQDTLLACVLDMRKKCAPLYGIEWDSCGNITFEWQSAKHGVHWFPMGEYAVFKLAIDEVTKVTLP